MRTNTKPKGPIGFRIAVALDPLQRYTVPEANAYLRQSNARTYQQIKTGELRAIRDGGRTYIPGSEIARRSALPAAETAKAAT